MVSTVATQSRSASLIASFSVRLPDSTGTHLGAEELHAPDVQSLALDVDRAHVDQAVEPEQRRGGRCGDAVLAGAGLGDDPPLAHPLGEQRLAEDVVDLVRAGVGEVLPLQEHPDAEALDEPAALGDRRRPAGVGSQEAVEASRNAGIRPRGAERRLELLAGRDERLGHEPAAELAEAAARLRARASSRRLCSCVRLPVVGPDRRRCRTARALGARGPLR